MFVSLCVHKHAHIRTSKCVHSHGELKRFRIDFLLTAGKNRDAGERRRKTRGRGQGKERGSESVAFSVLGRGEWAELSGRVCGQPEAVIGWNANGRLSIWEKSCAGSDGNTFNAHVVLTHWTDQNTCQVTGGGGNNKAHLIMLVPADTSHANTHAWRECKQTQLPVTTRSVSSAETNTGPDHAESVSYQNLPAHSFQETHPNMSTFSEYQLCNHHGDICFFFFFL